MTPLHLTSHHSPPYFPPTLAHSLRPSSSFHLPFSFRSPSHGHPRPLILLRDTNPSSSPPCSPLLCSNSSFQPPPRVSITGAEGYSFVEWKEEGDGVGSRAPSVGGEDLGPEGEVFQRTLRLVECAMLASVAGLTYILSNSLAIENYFGCFFSLPIVISSMRWGLSAGRKTMVATAMLLLTLTGPVKAITYLLMHGFVGLTMGSLWRLRVNWSLSIFLCTFVRALGAVGYVLLSSFLIRENILYLISINIHASLMGVLAAVGVNTILTMNTIYTIFGVLLMINCGCFVFLLHIFYAVFFSKLGTKDHLTLPRWLAKAI